MLGAGLFAANLSTTFRLRKFGMADGATFPLMFQVSSGLVPQQMQCPAGAEARHESPSAQGCTMRTLASLCTVDDSK